MLYLLEGKPQHYIWGGKQYIPQLFELESNGQPYAEWWLGTHPSATSLLQINQQPVLLSEHIKQHTASLGQSSLQYFGAELPYLLKILDVAQPLSIQLHPTKQQAILGFERENQLGIALDDPKRTYKDRNHKPEMMIALSDFWLLHGFKTRQAIMETLTARASLSELAEKLAKSDIATFYAEIMQAKQPDLERWLLPIIEKNQENYTALSLDDPDYWVVYSLQAMNIPLDKLDVGLLSFYLFNIVHLQAGEGIFQDAGIPHAYLRGQNIELMACSDNVIRGGLTPKYVDIAQLLATVDCREIVPAIIPVAPTDKTEFTYQTPAKDFALTRLSYTTDSHLVRYATSAEILLVMEGVITVSEKGSDEALTLAKGRSIFIEAGSEYIITGIQGGYAVVASTNEPLLNM